MLLTLLCHLPGALFLQEVCTLLLATHVLGDHLSLLNWLGFAVCLLGISLHVALKAFASKGNAPLARSLQEPAPPFPAPLLGAQTGLEAFTEGRTG